MQQSDNLSAVLFKKGDLRLVQTPIPSKPGNNEVLLATQSVGICGSDVHYWVEGRIGSYVVNEPIIMGHETSATVVEVGEGVQHLKPGDRVAIEPGVPCRKCNHCKVGKYNLCANIFFHATPPDNGTLTRYFKHAADFCFKLPDNVSFEEGALLEPLSVAVYACKRAGVTIGSNVLICGAGPIGLVSLLASKAFGASRVCITDINEKRLQTAKDLGADCILNVINIKNTNEIVDCVKQCFGRSPDITIECSGAEASIKLAILATESGGCVQLVGMGPSEVTVPLLSACCREVDIRGIFRYRNSYPQALELVASGKVNVKPLITHRFTLEETLKAFETAKNGEGIKVMINCAKN
ncbi:sorbitol dehydrogenase-like protein [Dinothrombium tinctorium]|uniref:Sorbitol dehydrogenase n=1 Tax=Dinothrombium tinctorium TaxID=1965070 RepID=A0A443RM07_9ACAR|nr:sorbitol dehydrogenase-like protein [Dinothrombium tinctorium]